MKAKVIPWSSVVGTGVLLTDDSGKVIGQLALHNVALEPAERTAIREKHEAMAKAVADAINEACQARYTNLQSFEGFANKRGY